MSDCRSRGYLPHYDAAGHVQHIVFRLADALPTAMGAKLRAMPAPQRIDAVEATLDTGMGSMALADPRIAALVESALLHFDGERYRLLAWCVMPTHVHTLVAQIESWPLASVLHSWKSFTANRANALLTQRGRFWAREYFDRTIRGETQLERAHLYIEANPVTAGLCASPDEWPWSSARRSAGF